MDLYALPSWREGMPLTIVEAMASGLPVVATDIRGCREEVVDGVTGYLVPRQNPALLARAIVRLVENPELARQMGRAGQRRARADMDETKIVQQQVSAYQRLVARSQAER